MAYYEIIDSQVNPNKAITSRVGYQLRDNIFAVAGGELAPNEAPLGPCAIQRIVNADSPYDWTVPNGCTRIRVMLQGGGGGGGGT